MLKIAKKLFFRKFFIFLFLLITMNIGRGYLYAAQNANELNSYYFQLFAGGFVLQELHDSNLQKLQNDRYAENGVLHLNYGSAFGSRVSEVVDIYLKVQTFSVSYSKQESTLVEMTKDQFIHSESLASDIENLIKDLPSVPSREAFKKEISEKKVARNNLSIRYIPVTFGINLKLLDRKMAKITTGFNVGPSVCMGESEIFYSMEDAIKSAESLKNEIENLQGNIYSDYKKDLNRISDRRGFKFKPSVTLTYGVNLGIVIDIVPGLQAELLGEVQNLGKFAPKEIYKVESESNNVNYIGNAPKILKRKDASSTISYGFKFGFKITF